jgi:FlaA1/EpsC-like NDP-sugar epimerase
MDANAGSVRPYPRERVEQVLGRTLRPPELLTVLAQLATGRVLVTGAAGSIGVAVSGILLDAGIETMVTDREELDVRRARAVSAAMASFRPTVVFHLAGAKHAPHGEVDPLEVMEVNGIGTANVVAAARMLGARVVTASTCKACDPETAYGASKLLAERLTLAAGEVVARFYNVVETSGNVFEIWDQLADGDPIPVAACRRYFVSIEEAAALTLWAAVLPPGRYTIDPGEPRWMEEIARDLYPGRAIEQIPPRRGDRVIEPRHAGSERVEPVAGVVERVWSPHDAEATHPRAHQALAA